MHYCGYCGTKLVQSITDKDKWYCPYGTCVAYAYFFNPASSASIQQLATWVSEKIAKLS